MVSDARKATKALDYWVPAYAGMTRRRYSDCPHPDARKSGVGPPHKGEV